LTWLQINEFVDIAKLVYVYSKVTYVYKVNYRNIV